MTNLNEIIKQFTSSAEKSLPGRSDIAQLTLAGVLTGGHILIEDIPGVGKTTLALILARLLGLHLNRIQCTNDMLPSDLIGPTIWHPGLQEFQFRPGPIFAEMVLVDELNRAPSKTQGGLLQAMEEKQISVNGKEIELPKPFIVLATQNPSDGIANNPLPDSQLDRFCLSINLPIPDREIEKIMILESDVRKKINDLPQLFNKQLLLEARTKITPIFIHNDLVNYAMKLLETSRTWPARSFPLSTRTGRDLILVAKALAFLNLKNEVLPQHIAMAFPHVAGHRLGGSKGVQFGQAMAKEILGKVAIP